MRFLHQLRLLLEVLGALFLGMITIAPLVFGVLPYEGLTRLGSIPFYALLAAAFAAWAWLAARSVSSRGKPPLRTPGTMD